MRALLVVEAEVIAQALFQLHHRLVLVQVDMLILDRAPEPLDEHIVQGAPATIHADADVGRFQVLIWLGCRLYSLAHSLSVLLPLAASSATLSLS